jgi:alanyl-tRNA synthetase
MLSTGAPELPAAVQRLLTDGKAMTKDRQKLREELATFQGAALAGEVPVENGLRLVVRAWKDRDRDSVRLLASRTAAAAPSTAVIFFARESEPARVFVARSPDLNFDCGRILREQLAALGLRGGGSPDLAQGDVPSHQEADLRAAMTEAIYKALATANR